MAYPLSDIYIGDKFPLTQKYGARPLIYSSRYGIRAHNGLDIGCPTMTPIVSAAPGFVSFGMNNGLGVYLSSIGLSLDLTNNPEDVDAGEKVNRWIAALIVENQELRSIQPEPPVDPNALIDQLPENQKASLLKQLFGTIKNFVLK
jgi:hypothetical protein